MIKKIVFFIALACSMCITAKAQSSMTDQQVLEYIKTAQKSGKNQKMITQELSLKGVNRAQAERVKKLYEKEQAEKERKNTLPTDSLSKRRRINLDFDANEDIEDERVLTRRDSLLMDPEDLLPDSLKVFGRNVFRNKKLTFAPSENIATPQNYQLGPGDEVVIDIFGANQTTLRDIITPEGSINVDILGPIYLSGMTIKEANTYLKKRLASIYAGLNEEEAQTEIRLNLGQIRTIQVNVLGDVRVPGTYVLSSFSTVFHALYMAGGIKEPGSLRNIKVNRHGKTVATVDVYDFLVNGSRESDIRLQEGDVILVPSYDCMVQVKGLVKRPQLFEMKQGESLAKLITYAGGFAKTAYTQNITVIRQTGKEYEVCTVDEDDFKTFGMKNGDEITVGELLSRFKNRVQIEGAVYKAGVYQLSNNVNTVKALIEKADGLLPEAFTNRAVLRRENADRSLETQSVDIAGIMKGSVPDIILKNNDALFIPSIYDLKDQGTLTIHGEVAAPGVFPYAGNTTVEDLVIQAGGLLESASLAQVDVARRIKNVNSNKAEKTIAQTFHFKLKEGFVIDGDPSFTLEPYDEVFVRKSPSYSEQQHVTITGEANFTGTFVLSSRNERLSDIIAKAGGVTEFAYTGGAKLIRIANDMELQRMKDVYDLIKREFGTETTDSINIEISDKFSVGIDLAKALQNPGSAADVVLREGDELIIPEMNNTVKIDGAVLMPNTVTYKNGKTARYYIDQAGGFANYARRHKAFVIHMNGNISRAKGAKNITPGCEIVVPIRDKNKPSAWTSINQTLSILTSLSSLGMNAATLTYMIKNK